MPLDPRFRFDTLVVGAANRLAVAAARAVAESPGAVYNPLFVYGGPGLGKTHLLGAIAHEVAERYPQLLVSYMPLDELIDDLHRAIATNETDQLKTRLQNRQLLLLDDVQFLTGRPETQSEVLRLQDVKQAAGRQIVMASDRAPGDIADVDERLVSRLSGGLLVDLAAPDYETRVAIARAYARERQAEFEPGVLEELAQVEMSNVRELQGAFNRLLAHQSLGEPVTPARVRALLGAPPAPQRAAVTSGDPFANFLTDIASAVAEHVDGWRSRLAEAVEHWAGEGYRTGMLEELLAANEPPANWEAVLRSFPAIVERLRALEAAAVAIDRELAGSDVLRDPERVADAERLVERLSAQASPPPGPDPVLTRETLVAGAANSLALKAADEIIARPGKRYNPLYVYGPAGAGKTHLAHAIANGLVAASGGSLRVGVVRGGEFADELISAIQDGIVSRWRARYRALDALIVDDVQAVNGTERTQEELFHVFNALAGEGKQLVFVADRPPQALDALQARLRSRFEGGLVAEMGRVDRSAPAPAPAPRRTPRNSLPSIGAVSDSFFFDEEKLTWEWPDLGARIIEEVR